MRVLLVTHDHPFRGRSGVAAYCRDLLGELRDRGIEVVHLYSAERGWGRGPRLRAWTEEGVRFAAVLNSPAPPALSVDRPLQDCGDVRMERLLARFLREARPDVVHVHSLMGFTASLFFAANQLGLPVVVTLHDFWTLCAQVSLTRPDGTPCEGPNGGLNCARFCAGLDRPWRRLYRRLLALLPTGSVRSWVERAGRAYGRSASRDPWTPPGASDGGVRPDRAKAYGGRAARLLASLREAHRILAVSRFVAEVYRRHGLAADRIQVLPLGLRIADEVRWRLREASPPVRFGYLGRVVPHKGAHLLARAAAGIPTDRARFLFFGPAGREARAYLQRLAGSRPLEFYGPYRREDLPRVLQEVDVAVVPTLFQETVGLTALEPQAAGIPVVASAIGAIPEWVQDGENGLLFPPGDPEALRERLLRITEDPCLVARLSAKTQPPESIRVHVERLLAIYEACLAHGRAFHV